MRKIIQITPILIALLSSAAPAVAGVHWGYEGNVNPEKWGQLSPEYQLCDSGKNQSPVNIAGAIKADAGKLVIHYGDTTGDIVNNGHTVQITEKNPDEYITVNGKKYSLIQFHFHSPSENHIDGKSFPVEGHFVHQDADGDLLVMAVMFEEGNENKSAAELLALLKEDEEDSTEFEHINIKSFIPKNTSYYRFSGSLTTPPCSEGVTWIVLKDTMTLSESQIEKFRQAFKHHNNRPVQPLHGRIIITR